MNGSKILLVQLRRLGDLVQVLPVAKVLKENDRDNEITLVALAELGPLVADLPYIDRHVFIPAGDIPAICAADQNGHLPPLEYSELGEKYRLVVNLTNSPESARLCRSISSQAKSGLFSSSATEVRVLGDWGKYFFAAVHQRQRNLFNLVDIYLGMAGALRRPVADILPIKTSTLDRARQVLHEAGLPAGELTVGFHLGANKRQRAWPVTNFRSLGRQLAGKARIVLFGGAEEKDLAAEFQRGAEFPFVDLVGTTTLTDLPAFLCCCDLFVSSDTGPIHVAAAAGTRTLGLYFASAFYAETAPYGAGNFVLQALHPCWPCAEDAPCPRSYACVEALRPEAVAEAVGRILGWSTAGSFNHPGLLPVASFFMANGIQAHTPCWGNGFPADWDDILIDFFCWQAVLLPGSVLAEDMKTGLADNRLQLNMLRQMASRLQDGLLAAEAMAAATVAENGNAAKLAGWVERLQATEKWMLHNGNAPSLWREWYHLEMMDMEEKVFPGLARELAAKYAKLLAMAELQQRFRQELLQPGRNALADEAGLS